MSSCFPINQDTHFLAHFCARCVVFILLWPYLSALVMESQLLCSACSGTEADNTLVVSI